MGKRIAKPIMTQCSEQTNAPYPGEALLVSGPPKAGGAGSADEEADQFNSFNSLV